MGDNSAVGPVLKLHELHSFAMLCLKLRAHPRH